MARTRGAKDNKARKKPAAPRPTTRHSSSTGTETKATTVPAVDRPALPPDDFKAAIAAELGVSQGTPGQEGTLPEAGPPSPAPGFDPGTLTIDGLASAWQVPFWAIGRVLQLLRVIGDPEPVFAVGRRRAKDLAKPSYEVYAHYARQYLQLNPDNSVHVAIGVTGLNGVGIIPELVEAIVKARKQALVEAARQTVPPAGAAT